MKTILIGIKPNIFMHSPLERFLPFVSIIIPGDLKSSCSLRNVEAEFVSELYEGNKHQKECVECYKGRDWLFIIVETKIPFSKLEGKKAELREKLKHLSGPQDQIGDNSVHISDSQKAARYEIGVVKKYFLKSPDSCVE